MHRGWERICCSSLSYENITEINNWKQAAIWCQHIDDTQSYTHKLLITTTDWPTKLNALWPANWFFIVQCFFGGFSTEGKHSPSNIFSVNLFWSGNGCCSVCAIVIRVLCVRMWVCLMIIWFRLRLINVICGYIGQGMNTQFRKYSTYMCGKNGANEFACKYFHFYHLFQLG